MVEIYSNLSEVY